MSENLLHTLPGNNQSPTSITTDESEVGSFIGDHMSSASSSFEGFDVSNNFQINTIPSQSRNKVGLSRRERVERINTLIPIGLDSDTIEDNVDNFHYPSGDSNRIAAAIENEGNFVNTSGNDQNEVNEINKLLANENNNFSQAKKVSKDFSINFSMIKDTSLCETSLSSPSPYPPPSVTPVHNFGIACQPNVILPAQINTFEGFTDRSVANNNEHLTFTEVTTETQTNKVDKTRTDGTTKPRTDSTTPTDTYNRQTEATELILTVMGKIDNKLKVQGDQLKVLSNQSRVQGDQLNNKLDHVQSSVLEVKGDVEDCKRKVISVDQKTDKINHEVESLAAQILNNRTEILKLTQANTQMECIMAEKLLNNRLHVESKIELIKGEFNYQKTVVDEINVSWHNVRLELEELKNRYVTLEGAVNNNRDHGNQLNARVVGLANHMLNGTTNDPMVVKSLLQQLDNRNSTPCIPKQIFQDNQDQRTNDMPSVSSSPLVSPNFGVPDAIVRPAPQTSASNTYQVGPWTEEEFIMKGIFKREKIPSFDGSNISAPQFLEESEAYFSMVNILSDKNKVKIVGSFMSGVAMQWWKRIAREISTWEEAKKEILEQYFNDYNRQKFKEEWKQHDCEKAQDIEQFVLQEFHLLDIVKPNYSFKRKCQTVASRLPPPLMTFLLQKGYTSERDFMNDLKEAMILTNFRHNPHSGTNNNARNYELRNNNNSWRGNNNQTNNNDWGNNNQRNNNMITNSPDLRRPSNFNPHYKQTFRNSNYYNRNQNYNQNDNRNQNYNQSNNRNQNFGNQDNYRNNYNFSNNTQNGRNRNGRFGSFNSRSWYNNSRSSPRPYDPSRNDDRNSSRNQQATTSRNGNGQAYNPRGVGNVALANPQAPVPQSTMPTLTSGNMTSGNMSSTSPDTVFLSATLFNQLFKQNYPTNASLTGDGLTQQGQNQLN